MYSWNDNGKGLIWKVYGEFGELSQENVEGDRDLQVVCSRGRTPTQKVAAFDLDGTLVRPASGNIHPKNEHDWQWLADVRERLRTLAKAGFSVVIISNQGSKNPAKIEQFRNRVDLISSEIDNPFLSMAGLGDSRYRKPQTGMWEFYKSTFSANPSPESFFVGDAAGRAKDFNDTDRTFALNCGLRFYTPEEYFYDTAPEPFKLKLTFSDFLHREDPKEHSFATSPQELLVCVGPPASGKSSYVKTHIAPHGYVVVNQDSLKTKQACVKAVETALKNGKSVVLDNTNPSKECRKVYIDIARAQNIGTRILLLDTSPAIWQHNNAYRHASGIKDRIPDIVYRIYKKKYEAPSAEEGSVLNISFEIDTSLSDYQKYYV